MFDAEIIVLVKKQPTIRKDREAILDQQAPSWPPKQGRDSSDDQRVDYPLQSW